MSERFSVSSAEDAIAQTNDFLYYERNAVLDGDFASHQLNRRVLSVAEAAEYELTARPIAGQDGYYAPLSKYNSNEFANLSQILPGYIVLVPGNLVNGVGLFPAVISELGTDTSSLRAHVLKQPYAGRILPGTNTVLSASGQSETAGVGEHGRVDNDGLEAEHFATLLAVGKNAALQADWKKDLHINHDWKKSSDGSVMSEVSRAVFGNEVPLQTITITRQEVEAGQASLLWHEGLRDLTYSRPETAARQNALITYQALGFVSLDESATDNIKGLIA